MNNDYASQSTLNAEIIKLQDHPCRCSCSGFVVARAGERGWRIDR